MSEILDGIYGHNLWANLRILDLCEQLTDEQLDAAPPPGLFGTIRETLKHMFGAEERYVFRVTGKGPEKFLRDFEDHPTIEDYRERARKSGQTFIELARTGLSDEQIVITDADGTFEISPTMFMVQAINHATEHRTHIMTALTQQGMGIGEDYGLDGWGYGQRSDEPWIKKVG